MQLDDDDEELEEVEEDMETVDGIKIESEIGYEWSNQIPFVGRFNLIIIGW